MAFANTSITDLIATGIEHRTDLADNVLKNNAVTAYLKKKGKTKSFSGGHKIICPLAFQENANGGAYSGYDTLSTSPSDVISASEWTIKQYAVPVTVSGLETLQNAGKEQLIDLVSSRIDVAQSTLANLVEVGVMGDGTGYSGKAITGLGAIVESTATASQTSTVGGISRTTWAFWRNYCVTGQTTNTAATMFAVLNTAWADLSRGADHPDLLLLGSGEWARYCGFLQALQQFTSPSAADLGFPALKYMGTCDVVLGGGVGGGLMSSSGDDTDNGVFLNTKYLHFYTHRDRNFKALPQRFATSQDAAVVIVAWAGNLACSGAQFQGRYVRST